MSNTIKAILLSAGYGTRLRPLTINKPKCLMEIDNEPVLGRWLKELKSIGCKYAIVNTHYLAEQVSKYLKSQKPSTMEISEQREEVLLGTAGTLMQNRQLFKGCTGVLLHTDNVTGSILQELLDAHLKRPKQCNITMLTFRTEEPSKCGIVEIDKNNIVTSFHEKVANPPGNIANGAVYIFEDSLFDEIDKIESPIKDFSADVLCHLIGKIYTHNTNKPYIDIGTPERLARAQALYGQADCSIKS